MKLNYRRFSLFIIYLLFLLLPGSYKAWAQINSATDTIQNVTSAIPEPATPEILIPKSENTLYIFDLESYLAKILPIKNGNMMSSIWYPHYRVWLTGIHHNYMFFMSGRDYPATK